MSCAATAQEICIFVFIYEQIQFSHDVAHVIFSVHDTSGKTTSPKRHVAEKTLC